jgi:hypothetical protein
MAGRVCVCADLGDVHRMVLEESVLCLLVITSVTFVRVLIRNVCDVFSVKFVRGLFHPQSTRFHILHVLNLFLSVPVVPSNSQVGPAEGVSQPDRLWSVPLGTTSEVWSPVARSLFNVYLKYLYPSGEEGTEVQILD